MQLSDRTCLHCLRPLSAICFDKRGKVYTKCYGCGARTFAPSGECLRGLALLTDFASKIAAEMDHDPKYARENARKFAAFIEELRSVAAPPPIVSAQDLANATAPGERIA